MHNLLYVFNIKPIFVAMQTAAMLREEKRKTKDLDCIKEAWLACSHRTLSPPPQTPTKK